MSRMNDGKQDGGHMAVRIVAVLFMLYGLEALVETVFTVARDGAKIPHPGVLAIPIAAGLWRGREGWRICARIVLTLPILGGGMLATRMCFGYTPRPEVFSWLLTDQPPRAIAFAWVAIVFSLALWQYLTLQRADVREYFKTKRADEIGHTA